MVGSGSHCGRDPYQATRLRPVELSATDFLTRLQRKVAFPIAAIQVDGGSEFMAQFEEACQAQGIRALRPSPTLPQAQWSRRAGSQDSPRGVLGVL